MNLSFIFDFFNKLLGVNEKRQDQLFEKIKTLNLDEEDTKKLFKETLDSYRWTGRLWVIVIVVFLGLAVFAALDWMGIFDTLKGENIEQATKILIREGTDDKNYYFDVKDEVAYVNYQAEDESDPEKLGKINIDVNDAANFLIAESEDDDKYTIKLENEKPYVAYNMKGKKPLKIGDLNPLGKLDVKNYVAFADEIASYEPKIDSLQQLNFGSIKLSFDKSSVLLSKPAVDFNKKLTFWKGSSPWNFHLKVIGCDRDIIKSDVRSKPNDTLYTYTIQFSEGEDNWSEIHKIKKSTGGKILVDKPLIVGKESWQSIYLVVLGVGFPGAKKADGSSCTNCRTNYNVANQLNAFASAVYIESSK